MNTQSNEIEDILDKKLFNNDKHLIKEILSYLSLCYRCGKYANMSKKRHKCDKCFYSSQWGF